ncbi:MAG: flagellar motor protein MotB [Alphaproteobacteria bacterium]
MDFYTNGRRPVAHEDDSDSSWLATYADAITLLLGFFVMLAAISKIDLPVFEKVQAGIAQDLGGRTVAQPTTLLKSQVVAIIESLGVADAVTVATDDRGIVLEFAGAAFFVGNTAELGAQGRPVLETVARTLQSPRYSAFRLSVETHTDDTPPSAGAAASNWELSALRSAAVVRLFAAAGVPAWRMSAVGWADTQPKLPNRDAIGNALPNNQIQNRRLVVRISK